MSTQCTPPPLAFHAFGRRQVVGRFDAGRLTSDGGTLLLREVARQWHSDSWKRVPVFEDFVQRVDMRASIQFFWGFSKKRLRFGMGYGNLRLAR